MLKESNLLINCRGIPLEVASRSRPSPKPMNRLPQINYNLMNDQTLRKKLANLSIPNTDPQLLLTKRHTKWVNLINANCDSSKTKIQTTITQRTQYLGAKSGKVYTQ